MERNLITLILCLGVYFSDAQISVVNVGSPIPNRILISSVDEKVVIFNFNDFIKRSNDECNSFFPLTVAEPGDYNILTRIDTSISYMLSGTLPQARIHKSLDGGNTWSQKYATTTLDLRSLAFFDKDNIIAACGSYKLLKTSDGGQTWTVTPGPTDLPIVIKTYSDSLVAIGDGSGNIYISKDKGLTWPILSGLPYTISDIFFLNKDTVFATSFSSSNGPAFKRSLNGGNSWTNLNLPSLQTILHIYFKNKNEGYVLGEGDNNKGVILKTTDLGQNWVEYNTNLTTELLDIEFINDSIALVSGTNGILFKWNTKQTTFVSVKDHANDNIGVNIFPNPVKDKLVIEFKNSNGEVIEFNLFNGLGKELNLISKTLNSKIEIDTECLKSGIYYLKVHNSLGQRVFKIIRD